MAKFAILLLPYFHSNSSSIQKFGMDNRIYQKIGKPWLKNVDPQFIFTIQSISYVYDDVSIYYYLKWRGINCDYLFGNDPKIIEKAKLYDRIFLITFDKLQALHTLEVNDPNAKIVEEIFSLPNLYPNPRDQELIYHKNKYLDLFKKHHISILPFLHLPSSTSNLSFFCSQHSDFWSKSRDFIIKPIFGQHSIDIQRFTMNGKEERTKEKREEKEYNDQDHTNLNAYFAKFKTKYPGFIIQPYLHKLKDSFEYRNYFIGGKYLYTVRTQCEEIESYIEESECKAIVDYAKYVYHRLFKNRSYYILRIDIAYQDQDELFVSEVEFVPYLFTHLCEVNKLNIDQKIGNAILSMIQSHKKYYSWYFILVLILITLFYLFYLSIKRDTIII